MSIQLIRKKWCDAFGHIPHFPDESNTFCITCGYSIRQVHFALKPPFKDAIKFEWKAYKMVEIPGRPGFRMEDV